MALLVSVSSSHHHPSRNIAAAADSTLSLTAAKSASV
jgi:hypothetical protein